MLSIHLKWDFLRRRTEECDSSKKANQNQDSILGSTLNLKEGAGRLLQQNLPVRDLSTCNNFCPPDTPLLDHLIVNVDAIHSGATLTPLFRPACSNAFW